jgi:hypothetical protein
LSKSEAGGKKAYFVSHRHPGGETVAVVFANNADQITRIYPPLRVTTEPPPWVDEQMIASMTSRANDVDHPEVWLHDFMNPPDGPRIIQIP